MNLTILAAIAAAALPLPEGRGGSRLIPLPVTSDPPGATVSVRFRTTKGAEGSASCVTPCVLTIPRSSPFILEVEKDGVPFVKPPLRWDRIGPNLSPPALHAVKP